MTPDPLRSPEAPHADQPRSIQAGDVVQIDPMHDERFGGCLLLVTEAKSWGVMGFVSIPHADGPTSAYYRAPYSAIERVGHAPWCPASEESPCD